MLPHFLVVTSIKCNIHLITSQKDIQNWQLEQNPALPKANFSLKSSPLGFPTKQIYVQTFPGIRNRMKLAENFPF